jgi:branched-chain amino acid transport system permease protein
MSTLLSFGIFQAAIATGAFYALLAMALQMTYSGTGMLNFAQGDLAIGGAYSYYVLNYSHHINSWVALIITMGFGAVAGSLVFLILWKFLGRSSLEATLASVGISFALEGGYQYFFGSNILLPNPIMAGAPLHMFGSVVPRGNIIIVAVAIVMLASLFVLMKRTRLGLMIRSVASNPYGARAMGISDNRTRGVVFALGGVLSFGAGALIGSTIGASSGGGQLLIVSAFVGAVVGGLGSSWTAALGGLVLGALQTYLGATSAGTFTETWTFALLMIVLLVMPKGLFGRSDVVNIGPT